MSKVKEWLYDEVEGEIDKICQAYKEKIITKEEALSSLMKIEHADVYVGAEMDYYIASEILEGEMEGVYA